MYSLNDITNGCVKVEIPVETPCNRASSQMLFPSEIHALKKEAAETPCSAVRQETISLPREAGYAVRSIEETSGQSDLLNIQITNVQGAPYNQNSSNDEVTANHIEDHANELSIRGGNNQEMQSNFDCGAHEKMAMGNSQLFEHVDTQETVYPVDTDVRSPINESSFYNGIPLAATAEQERETSRQLNSHEGVTSSHLSHHPYTESPQTPFSSFQMSNQYPLPGKYQTDGAMAGYQLDAQSVSSYQGDATVVIPSFMSSKGTVPLYHLAVQEEMTAPQVGDDARYQVKNYQPEMSSYHVGHYPHESPTVHQFHQKQNYDEGPNRRRSTGSTCHCCCHSPSEGDSYFSPAFGLENQRPSVIMVPVSWSSTTSGTSHVPLKVNTSYSPHSQNHRNFVGGLGYQNDSDSSDEDGDGKREKYFRMNIDGTTARFKLTKEDWERIPINTFPSGGRLLSGDWTRIFLQKVKESNPWCSLRFKNNHVRSENSRKIHSAVFFRGGAECKRPECNVKVRFVIQKEKGKYVDVTYVGNMCHSSEPGGGDAITDKKRNKRVRRTYSS